MNSFWLGGAKTGLSARASTRGTIARDAPAFDNAATRSSSTGCYSGGVAASFVGPLLLATHHSPAQGGAAVSRLADVQLAPLTSHLCPLNEFEDVESEMLPFFDSVVCLSLVLRK